MSETKHFMAQSPNIDAIVEACERLAQAILEDARKAGVEAELLEALVGASVNLVANENILRARGFTAAELAASYGEWSRALGEMLNMRVQPMSPPSGSIN